MLKINKVENVKNFDVNASQIGKVEQSVFSDSSQNCIGSKRATLRRFTQETVLLKYTINNTDQLYRAIFDDSPEAIRAAIAHGANVNEKDAKGRIPLVAALLTNKPNAVEELLKQGANAKMLYEGKSLFCYANTAKIAIQLLSSGASFMCINDPDENALEISLRFLHKRDPEALSLLEMLLKNGYPINSNISNGKEGYEKTALYSFLRYPLVQPEALKLIVKYGANVNQSFHTPNRQNNLTPLIWALAHGNLEYVKILLQAGADINSKANPLGQFVTPIQYVQRHLTEGTFGALSGGKAEAIEFLIRNGARM